MGDKCIHDARVQEFSNRNSAHPWSVRHPWKRFFKAVQFINAADNKEFSNLLFVHFLRALLPSRATRPLFSLDFASQ